MQFREEVCNCSSPHNITNRNCPVLKKHMKIGKDYIAFDNFPFLEVRLFVEKNIKFIKSDSS